MAADRSVGGGQIDRHPLHQPPGRTDRRPRSRSMTPRITTLPQPGIAARATAHGNDLPGIRVGRAAYGDGECAERTAGLCRLLAKLHAEIFRRPTLTRHSGCFAARWPRSYGRQARRRTVRRPAAARRHLPGADSRTPTCFWWTSLPAFARSENVAPNHAADHGAVRGSASSRPSSTSTMSMLAQMFAERIVGLQLGRDRLRRPADRPDGRGTDEKFTAKKTGRPPSAKIDDDTDAASEQQDNVISLEAHQPDRGPHGRIDVVVR